jgi:K+-transporting ATPase ATPase C chain
VIRRQLITGVLVIALMTAIVGVAYPLIVTAVAQIAFPGRADGSLVRMGDRVIGSRLLGQAFAAPGNFHPRPSAAGDGYDASASGASNLGPTSEQLAATVRTRAAAYRAENGLAPDTPVPIDAITASASGLDPDISPANALIQAVRVARVRGLPLQVVLGLVARHTSERPLGVLGEPAVNVLELNIALTGAH